VAHRLNDLPSAITLRPVSSSDREFLLQVYASTREEELRLVDWSADQKAAFVRMQFDAQDAYYREHYRPATFDVIDVDGEPVGRFYVARWKDEIRIMDIALLPEHRGNGVGTSLLRDLLAEADAAGKSTTIHVEKHNPALRLYERLGFAAADDRGVYVFLERPPAAT
jgi:ribosomal protein S18 acetylase RimI-like enzyme